MRNSSGNPLGSGIFKPVRIGGGGFVTGISISADGTTKVIRTDVYNGYVRGAGETDWRPLFTTTSLAVGEYMNSPGFVAPANAGNSPMGCYEAIVAPSNSSRIYATWNNRLYRSENTGTTFTKTALPDTKMWSNNGPDRLWGKKLAVDPQNPDVFLLGTHANGLYYSTDKGASVTNFSVGVNTGNNPNPHLVACDQTSSVSGGIKQRWFVVRQGTGVYVSTTGPGGIYTLMTGSPVDASDMKFDVNGNCYIVPVTGSALWKCAAGGSTWTQLTGMTSTLYQTVAINPANVNHIIVFTPDSFAAVTTNGGSTWLASGNYFANYPNPGTINEYSYTIPWLGLGKGQTNFPSMVEFDPVVSGRLWVAEGLGVRRCTAPTTQLNDATGRFDWVEETQGIEELVATHVLTPPGQATILNFWDKPIWRITNPDVFAREGPFCPGSTPNNVQAGWDTAYAADDPTWLAAIVNQGGNFCGYSTDAGRSWSRFPTAPPYNGNGGCIAIGNTGNVIIIYSNNGTPIYTKDGGTTWANLPFPNMPANGIENGFGFSYYVNRKIITYDPIAAAFYLYNYGASATPSNAGVWKSTNRGDTWTQIYAGKLQGGGGSDSWWAKLRIVPGNTGHLFYTIGKDFNDALRRSIDGGVTWTTVPNLLSVTDFGFGKAAPGKTYPTIYLYGTLSGSRGVWRSDDNCATWINLAGPYPGGVIDDVLVCQGDLNIYGRCYVGFSGSGFMYCDYNYPMTLSN